MKGVRDIREQETAPRWRVLYILLLGTAGLLWLEAQASLSPVWHSAVQFAIVLLFGGLTSVWLAREDGRPR